MTDQTQLPELPCQDFVEFVTAYLEDALSPNDRARFETHLAACAKCGMYVDQVRETIALTGRTPRVEELPRELREGLRDAFRRWAA
jgi:anti-sigma factor RsiW